MLRCMCAIVHLYHERERNTRGRTTLSRDQTIPVARGQRVERLDGLFEHAYQSIEKSFLLIADILTVSRRLLAVEDHQLGKTRMIAHSLFVMGDGLLRFGNGRVLVTKRIRSQPASEGFLVRRQHIFAQAKAGVKERLIAFVCGVEVVKQIHECGPVKHSELIFDIAPRGLQFQRTFGYLHL